MVENRIKDIEICDPHNLTPHPKNRNKHSKEQIERLCQILKYQGWRYPIKVSRLSGYITSGHGRREAAIKMGLTEVPVSFQEYESEEQEYADVIADNAIASWSELDMSGINFDLPELGPDFDIDLLGIKDFVLEPADKFNSDPDEVPEPPKEAITKTGDLWLLGDHRLLCGDSTKKEDVERLMNGEKADMVFTDPPYNVASDSTNYVGDLRPDSYGKLSRSEWDKEMDIIPALRSISSSIAENFTAYICTSQFLIQKIWDWFSQEKSNYVSYLVWNKPNPMPSLSKRHPTFNTELIVYVANGKDRVVNFPVEGHFLSCRTVSQKTAGREHPTQKPIELIEPIVCFSSNNQQLVLDLFLGSGSTLIACEKTNRKCYGMEIDPLYCDVIVARWEKFTGKKAIRG